MNHGKKAADWLADVAKKSEEALAQRGGEKELAPPPDEKALVEALAAKDHTEYDRVRRPVAKKLGIRVGTLDDKVEAVRKKRAKPCAIRSGDRCDKGCGDCGRPGDRARYPHAIWQGD